jgi:hypothetical protein
MAKTVLNDAVAACLDEIHARLSEAARIARAAQACAQAGSLSEAVAISMDIEQLIYEAGRLHDAASLLNRLRRTEVRFGPPRPAAKCRARVSGSTRCCC